MMPQLQMVMFMKNVAILGDALLIWQFGAEPRRAIRTEASPPGLLDVVTANLVRSLLMILPPWGESAARD